MIDNGQKKDQLQLKFLHVSKPYRGQGLGRRLFELAKVKAHQKGAKRLYISATPSENTVDFCLRLGCRVTQELDPGFLKRHSLVIGILLMFLLTWPIGLG